MQPGEDDVVTGLEGCAAYARLGFDDFKVVIVAANVCMAGPALYDL